jgi:hypothetical protein
MTMTQTSIGVLITYTGRSVRPLDLKPKDVDPRDIAHALANIARYNGHTDVRLSVAEHSVRCARRVPKGHPDRPWLLMHDASEYLLGDLVAPLKYLPEFAFYLDLEDQVQAVICERFGLPAEEPEIVHEVDLAMRATEMRDLKTGVSKARMAEMPDPYPFKIVPWSAYAAEREFLKEMKELGLK